MPQLPPPSPPLLVALERLRGTDVKALFRAAVRDLIERQVLTLRGGGGSPAVLVPGPERAPAGSLPGTTLRLVLRTPPSVVDGVFVRDLSEVARSVASDAAARRELVQAALDDLVEGGWATVADRRVLGVPLRPRYRRSAAGDAVLAERRGRADGGGDATGALAVTGTGGHHDGTDRSDDLDKPFDTSFDRSFDPSFDRSFDSSFDSGYTAGDGGSSGGDGGGGGGGGGD